MSKQEFTREERERNEGLAARANGAEIPYTVIATYLLLVTRSGLPDPVPSDLLAQLHLKQDEYLTIAGVLEKDAHAKDALKDARTVWSEIIQEFARRTGNGYSDTSCPSDGQFIAIAGLVSASARLKAKAEGNA